MKALPIEWVLPALRTALDGGGNAVLIASPGAGKTTRVPLALKDSQWLQGRKIVMLEPRRLAARAAAAYIAGELGEKVGETVGYRVKHDTKVGPSTVVEVVTEGVLTRMLQRDPSLEDVGLVIFDEFHERNLHADTGLALCLQAQELFRPDLRLLAMSATMEGETVAELLGGAPVLTAPGRMFPVETIYADKRPECLLEEEAARTIRRALAEHEGDVLVFLPGAAEIRRVMDKLEPDEGLCVRPLYGQLTQREQDEALRPARDGRRKVVLATSIAETSLTVEGVRIVIDSGWMRVPRFSPRTGMTRLETVRVARSSADQRRGRAGRTAPGVCYRMWTEAEDALLEDRAKPEILEADLAPLMLELAVWGVRDPSELKWLDAPPAASVSQAKELLRSLDAIDDEGACTAHGRQMAELGVHPRLAHMMLRGAESGLAGLACDLAALLSERDVLRFERGFADADLSLRLDAAFGYGALAAPGAAADEAACRRVRQDSRELRRSLSARDTPEQAGGKAQAGLLLAFAYPDRIARRRPDGRYLLAGGRGAAFGTRQRLSGCEWIVVAELDDAGADGRILLAAELAEADLPQAFAGRVTAEESVCWDRETGSVRAVRRQRLGAILIREEPVRAPDPDRQLEALLAGIREEGLDILPWTAATRQWRQRLAFLHRIDPESWPDGSDEALLGSLEQWLGPHVAGFRSRSDLQRLRMGEVLETWLSWEQRRAFDELAPTHIRVPSGSRIAVDYSDPAAPVLAVRLQELFGLHDTPRLANGRVPVVIHLLSPAGRPVQVTSDLRSFWRTGYFEVKKDLKGRYPKHYWPDDPLEAVATNRVRPKP